MPDSRSASERLISVGRVGPADLWLASLDSGTEPIDRQQLTAAEIERADRFHFPSDRRRYTAAHALLRQLLVQRYSFESAEREFTLGTHGKPRLAGRGQVHFNLSHCGHVALLGVSASAEIGVDLEQWRQVPELLDLAAQVLTPAERHELDFKSANDITTRFLHLWTRKEACLKALGSGLSVEPGSFEVGLKPGCQTIQIDAPGWRSRLRVQTLKLQPGLIGALAWIC